MHVTGRCQTPLLTICCPACLLLRNKVDTQYLKNLMDGLFCFFGVFFSICPKPNAQEQNVRNGLNILFVQT